MKQTHEWHATSFGRTALWLGSIQLAVPVLAFVAVALAVGTYLDSTRGAQAARAAVYGAWWFIALMALVCVSLVFAVVTRFPWQRRHVGFITVHASLITLIIGGFWSLFGRLEGHLTLAEGTAGAQVETQQERLELLDHDAGQFASRAHIRAPRGPGTGSLGNLSFEVLERWDNISQEEYVADAGSEPLRAIELTLDPSSSTGLWAAEEAKNGGPSTIQGLVVRVLPDGADWEPPPAQAPAPDAGYAFVLGDTRYPLAAEGQEAFPGWTITALRRFASAKVSAGALAEGGGAEDNPAVDVTITDGKGTVERHTAFLNFPDMVMGRTLEGTARSSARLQATPQGGNIETLVVYGPVGATRIGYIAPDGSVQRIEPQGPAPWTVDAGQRRVRILRQFSHAHGASRFVKAPDAAEHRPALVLRLAGSAEPVVAAWKATTPIVHEGRNVFLRYGPRTVDLPFTVRLVDFQKHDYPGTEMAMSYESDVTVSRPGAPDRPFRVFMNHPYVSDGWKVYQSGFLGEDVSVFSVMRDPGLPMTYLGSLGLCVGIFVTFFSRRFSWGHPGIPVAFASKENPNVSPPAPHQPARGPVGEPVRAGV